MQKPPGVGNPARASVARFAAFGPTRDASVASWALNGTMNEEEIINSQHALVSLPLKGGGKGGDQFRKACVSWKLRPPPASLRSPPSPFRGRNISPHMIAVARQRIDDRDLLDREIRNDLDRILVHDQHFFDPHAVMEFFAVLGFEREGHALFDFDRMIERPDARDDRRV